MQLPGSLSLYLCDFGVILVIFTFKLNILSREVAQWLAPRICPANREVGYSNLIVCTNDPLG